MKKQFLFALCLLCALCAAVLLQSCVRDGSGTGKTDIDIIDIIKQNYPKIDGSTSALPIIQGIYKAMHAPETVDGEEVWAGLPQEASKTIVSYMSLIYGGVDLIIVPDPSEEVWERLEESGAEIEFIPLCLEALVFITCKENTADNINTEELKSIYTDMQINNWSQISGQDSWIEALARNEDSGSHALMEKFVLKGAKVNEIIENNSMIMGMFGMIDEIENYVNIMGGQRHLPLGYTVYYFFQNNKEEYDWDNVKILSIDGVEPNNETIASGEYPYTTNYYAVIRQDTPENSPIRTLISWLLSDDGQKIFADAGFGVIKQ
jgi:phosphate transport system substrate-binding protein